MYNFALSLLKLLPPETAHSFTINILKYSSKNKTIIDDPILSQHLMGLDFTNPLGLAAGFDKNAQVINSMFNFGFGFVEIGTVTPKIQRGNNRPRVFRLKNDEAIINHLGFNNIGSDKIYKNLKKVRKTLYENKIIGVNIGKNRDSINSIDDYLYGIEKFQSLSSYITINISSPNTVGLRDLQLRGNIENLIKKIKKRKLQVESINKKPLLIKISPDLNEEQLRDIALISLANNIDGLIISNTSISRPKNLKSITVPSIGGLSGKPIFQISNDILKKTYNLTNGQIPLIGVGGISNGVDCYQKIKSGASLVQLYTALIYSGPLLIKKIKSELTYLLKTDGYKNIAEAVGKSV